MDSRDKDADFLDVFKDIQRIVDRDKSTWLSILLLKRPTVLHPYRTIFVTYAGFVEERSMPRGSEQDWRLLSFFRYLYDLAIFNLRKEVKNIIRQRKELIRDLAPSIIHHEINSSIVNTARAFEELIAHLEMLRPGVDNGTIDSQIYDTINILTKSVQDDIETMSKITHSVMGLKRRALTEKINIEDELEQVIDLTGFRIKNIGGIISIVCSEEIYIITDTTLLMHILVNLINNAVDVLKSKKERFEKKMNSLNLKL